jgi:rhodanese-related sulfurtransferase
VNLIPEERDAGMTLTLIVVGMATIAVAVAAAVRMKHLSDQRQMEQHSITAEALHALLASNQEVLLFDVRQPLDLLAYPEIIPKARRVAPNEVLERPSLIPKEKDAVVYCTCPSDKTSRTVLRRALALQFRKIKFLKGGLAAWKANGYPVEPYNEVFHLYTPSLTARSG